MSEDQLVWSDEEADLRKKNTKKIEESVDESKILLELRRLTSGKGRTIIEIKGLPANKKWCKNLAKTFKKKLGVGGSFKNDMIEVHGEKLEELSVILNTLNLKFKKVGG